jgi:hypothetical protein
MFVNAQYLFKRSMFEFKCNIYKLKAIYYYVLIKSVWKKLCLLMFNIYLKEACLSSSAIFQKNYI